MHAILSLMVLGITCCLLQGSNAQQGFCIEPYEMIADKCYRFHQDSLSWQSAEMACAREGARLASVLTKDQYTGLLEHINRRFPGTYWISGVPRNGQWVWSAEPQTPAMATGWWGYGRAPAATAGRCSYFCSNTHRYWAQSCSTQDRFICEKNLMSLRPVEPEQTYDEVETFENVPAQ